MIQVIMNLGHLTNGTINAPFGNPIALALHDAGVRDATVTAGGILRRGTQIEVLPTEIIEFLQKSRVEDRFEALPPNAHRALELSAKKFGIAPSRTPLLSFKLRPLA